MSRPLPQLAGRAGRSVLALAALASVLSTTAAAEVAGKPAVEVPGLTAAAKAELTDAEVGDAASFGRAVNWLGLVSTFVELDTDCAPLAPTDPPRENCIVLNPAPAITSFDRPDIARITLPARSSRSLLCHWQTPIANVLWRNTTAASAPSRISIRPYYRFESEVLADPTLINPVTGLPFAGALEVSLTAVNEGQTLDAGEAQNRLFTFTRSCIAGVISRTQLVQTYGLSDEQARQFFRRPITVRAGLRGSAQLVEFASLNVGTRFVGD